MSIFDYNDPIITRFRKGDINDPYVEKTEYFVIENGKVVLTELPSKFHRVAVTGEGITWIEKDKKIENSNEYIVDYTNKIVTFDAIHNGKQLEFFYFGRGLEYLPTTMIYTKTNNGEVTETLANIIETGESAIENIQILDQKIQEVTTATTNANNQTSSMQTLENTVEANEVTRTNSETIRVQNEQTRITNENERELNESQRILNETERETTIGNLTHKDEYNPATTYQPRNIVSYLGSGYMCILESTGNIPTNTTYWKKLVSKGDKGATLSPKGLYDPAVTYQYGDLVTYDGSTYYAIQSTAGNLPTNITYWEVFMSGGGDMQKDTYDTNNNGQVDKADDSDKLGGKLPSEYEGNIYKQSTTPTTPELNDLWIDTTTTPHTFKLYNGTTWIEIGTKLEIDDTTTSTTSVWSSNKTNSELSSKATITYVDDQIASLSADGVPKLVSYQYVLTATTDNQTDFDIPLVTFVPSTDTVLLSQNRSQLGSDDYTIDDFDLNGTHTIRLNEGVRVGTNLYLVILKNVPQGTEGSVNASVLQNGTLSRAKIDTAFETDISTLENNVGDITTLTTTDKTNLVNATNEVVSKNSSLETNLGTLNTTVTDHLADYAKKIKDYGIRFDDLPVISVAASSSNVEILRIPSNSPTLSGIITVGLRVGSSSIGFKVINFFQRTNLTMLSKEITYEKASVTLDDAVITLSLDYRSTTDFDVVVRLTNNHATASFLAQCMFVGSNSTL